jgi:hypothetical protein
MMTFDGKMPEKQSKHISRGRDEVWDNWLFWKKKAEVDSLLKLYFIFIYCVLQRKSDFCIPQKETVRSWS